MDPSIYMARQYGPQGCWALVSDVYASEFGASVTAFKTVNSSVREIARAFRLALHKAPEGLSPIDSPADLAIVLLGKTRKLGLHHCGIYWHGSVLHALDSGNLYQDIASVRDAYPLLESWAWTA